MIQLGTPITQELKSVLQRLLNTQDLIDISAEVEFSYSTVRSLYYRTQSVTEENQEVVYKMVNKAFSKAEESITYFEKAKQELKISLPKN